MDDEKTVAVYEKLFAKLDLEHKADRIDTVMIDEVIDGVRVVGRLETCKICGNEIGSNNPCVKCRMKELKKRIGHKLSPQAEADILMEVYRQAELTSTLKFIEKL